MQGTQRPASTVPVSGLVGLNSVAYLDLLRAAAANLVLFGHASDIFDRSSVLPAGHIGISIFFLLSGFLILKSSLSRIQRPGPYFRPFMIDRCARIFTAYVPILLIVFCLNSAIDLGRWSQEGLSVGPAALLGNLAMLQNYPIFQLLHRLSGNGLYIRPYNTAEPFWSIPVEFWIYVFFALVFFGLFRRERLMHAVPLTLGLIAFPVVVWNAAAGGGNGLTLVWLVGAAAAYLWVRSSNFGASKAQVGAGLFLLGAVCLLGRGLKLGWDFQDLGMSICEMLMLLGGLSVMEGIRPLPVLVRGACMFFASYSFSLYLVHNTVLIVARKFLPALVGHAALPLAIVGAHISAFALYLLFERHYRRVGSWLKHGRFSPIRSSSWIRLSTLRG